ncbi:TcpE family conjugal transfer membrane protein [Microbispora sp. NPDC088329]|uniref:TcpE family conjugal transfer membrane protein n=1 Tax=Microbispora sp. NPDC088329 TaxID=3154869 RepID=UPI00341414FC
MDLPTYTNIWRIEKRLYKLYDLRLPMPLPVVWIGVFVGVSVPWWVFLYLIGLPFEAPWHVIYLVPPGVLTWLSTRPVIEGKRLTELLQSQLRYVSEPRIWCRMAPFDEPDEVALTARVWRTSPPAVAVRGRAARRARRAVSVKVPVPKIPRTGVRAAPGVAARAAAHEVDPSRVVRPAVAAAAAAAVPVTGTPAPSRSGTAARTGAAGERVFYLPEPSAPPASPAEPRAGHDAVREERPGGHVTGPDHGHDPDESHGHAGHGHAGHDVQEGHEPGSAEPESHAAPAEASDAPAVPPIGTETLRRLRRLAASAEPRAVSPSAVTSFTTPGEPAQDSSARSEPSGPEPATGESANEEPAHDEQAVTEEAPASAPSVEPADDAADPADGDQAAPQDTAQEDTAQEDTAPEDTAPEDTAPEDTAPEDTAPENTAQRDAEALEQHRKGRPPRLVRPRVPGGAWSGTSRISSPEPEPEPEQVPSAAGETAETGEHAEAVDRHPGDATTGPAPAADAATEETPHMSTSTTRLHAAQEAGPRETLDDTGSGTHTAREGTHAPGSRPYESAGGESRGGFRGSGAHSRSDTGGEEAAPAMPAVLPEPGVPTGKGSVTPPPAGPAGVSIRAVPAGPRAAGPAGPARPSLPAAGRTTPGRPAHEEPPRLRRVEAVVGRDTSGGWRRLAQVVVGGSRTDGMEVDEARTRIPLTTSRRIMVLGCTGGAGQTTTALMLGHTLARYREDRVLALDANTGEDTLTTRIAAESPETLSSLIEGSEEVTGYLGMRAYTTRCESGLEVVGADTDDRVTQRLAERAFLADWRRTLAALDRHYRLTVIDPAAALAARLLPYADQLVLVAPASEDASEAVAMTYEWLDGHGCSDLRRRAVMVINGVSRRSLPDVEQAEAVASGRCRAIVRVPWEDELAPGRPGPVDVNHLRMGGRRAYVALAGVIVSGLAAVQAKQEVAR